MHYDLENLTCTYNLSVACIVNGYMLNTVNTTVPSFKKFLRSMKIKMIELKWSIPMYCLYNLGFTC